MKKEPNEPIMEQPEQGELFRFAKWFAYNIGKLQANAVYTSTNLKYRVWLKNELPFLLCTNRTSTVAEINLQMAKDTEKPLLVYLVMWCFAEQPGPPNIDTDTMVFGMMLAADMEWLAENIDSIMHHMCELLSGTNEYSQQRLENMAHWIQKWGRTKRSGQKPVDVTVYFKDTEPPLED